jgi:hypothetical protein
MDAFGIAVVMGAPLIAAIIEPEGQSVDLYGLLHAKGQRCGLRFDHFRCIDKVLGCDVQKSGTVLSTNVRHRISWQEGLRLIFTNIICYVTLFVYTAVAMFIFQDEVRQANNFHPSRGMPLFPTC